MINFYPLDFQVFNTQNYTKDLKLSNSYNLKTPVCKTSTFQASYFNRIAKLWNYIGKFSPPTSFSTTAFFRNFITDHMFQLLLNHFDIYYPCTLSIVRSCPCHPQFLVSFKFNRILIIICILVFYSFFIIFFNIMGRASHGSSFPVRTCPSDLITSYHLAYIFYFFSVIYLVVCNMCNGQ